jgi:hypothetical protein
MFHSCNPLFSVLNVSADFVMTERAYDLRFALNELTHTLEVE